MAYITSVIFVMFFAGKVVNLSGHGVSRNWGVKGLGSDTDADAKEPCFPSLESYYGLCMYGSLSPFAGGPRS